MRTRLCISGHNGLRTQDDSFQPGSANFVDRCADRCIRYPGTNRALSCWVLAETVISHKSQLDRAEEFLSYFAERTFPKKTSSTADGSTAGTFARADLMACEPNWVAVRDASDLNVSVNWLALHNTI